MFCIYCGTENPDEAVFCRSCGKRQPVAASSTPVTEITILPGPPFPGAAMEAGQPPAGNMPSVQGTPTLEQRSVASVAHAMPSTLPSSEPAQVPSAPPSALMPAPAVQGRPAEPQLHQQIESHPHPTYTPAPPPPHSEAPAAPASSPYLGGRQVSLDGLKFPGHLSRRAVIVGLAGATTVAVAGGGITWLALSRTASGLAQRAAQYSGTWINDDPSTGGITKLIISNVGQKLTVHGYGACEPTDCDWDSRSGTFNGDPFVILFDFGGGLTDELTITLDNPEGTRLKVVDNGSHSGINTYFFHRAAGSPTASDLAQRAAQYTGTWINDNPRGWTRLIISNVGLTLTVHVYGACEPTDCDDGNLSGTFQGEPFVIMFSSGPRDRLSITLNAEGTQLKVVTNDAYTDFFHKQG